MGNKEIKEVEQIYKNLHGMASFNATASKEQVEYLIDNYSDLIFCYGRLRKIKFEQIIDSRYKVYTVEA
jgi:hypothetical protein